MKDADLEPGDLVVGVDIGGTHITVAWVDMAKQSLLSDTVMRATVDSRGSAEDIIESCCRVMKECAALFPDRPAFFGIAIPGPFDYEQGISLMKNQDKFDSLYQVNIKERFADLLSVPASRFRFINDAASFLKGEVFAGSAKGKTSVLGITLGTGLGSSYYRDNKVIDADLWHSPFREGIAEDYLCSRWFVQRYKELSGVELKGVKELTELAEKDENVQFVFDEFTQSFVEFLLEVPFVKQAEAVVIGGNISKANALFLEKMKKLLGKNNIFVELEVSSLKEYAALLGAASCWEAKQVEDSHSKLKNS